jgi:peptide/nickel transport system substrate-binding protein
MFVMPTEAPPWNDLHVRQAAAYALDRAAIIVAQGGYASPDYTLIPPQALQTVGSPAQIRELLKSVNLYPYSQAMAKQEMSESAYPHGASATILAYDYGSALNVTQVIAAELDRVGITTHLKMTTIGTAGSIEAGPLGQREAAFWPGGCVNPDVSGYDFFLGSWNLKAGNNMSGWAPSAVDQLLNAGTASTSAAARFPIYSKLVHELAANLPYVPLFLTDFSIALSSKYTVPHSFWQIDYGPFLLGIRPQAQ